MTAEFSLAVHALVYLLHKECVVSSQELADNICTSPARVRKVMTKLHKAGLVDAFQGKGSGYQSRPGSAELSLDRVLDALDEEPITMNWRSGAIDRECLISSGMGNVMDGLYADMNEACRRRLANMTVGRINQTIFARKKDQK